MKKRFTRKLNFFMMSFSRWFASPQGVLETFILTTIWTIFEFIFPRLDPNGFKFLYICTVWGVQTQNVLAYASTISTSEAQKNQDLLVQLAQNNVNMMEAILSLMENQEKTMNQVNMLVANIAKDVEEIQDEIIQDTDSQT